MAVDILRQEEDTNNVFDIPSEEMTQEELEVLMSSRMIWHRIESYIAHRFEERDVVWTLTADDGDIFKPPLVPFVSYFADIWKDGGWVPISLCYAPMGLVLPLSGTYRICARVGAGPIPVVVMQAFKRLASYYGDCDDRAGANSVSERLGDLETSVTRNPAWMARAMQNSGAADLLRPYRRA